MLLYHNFQADHHSMIIPPHISAWHVAAHLYTNPLQEDYYDYRLISYKDSLQRVLLFALHPVLIFSGNQQIVNFQFFFSQTFGIGSIVFLTKFFKELNKLLVIILIFSATCKEPNTNPSSRPSSSCRTPWKSSALTAGTTLSNMPPSTVPTISVSPSRMVRKSRHKSTAHHQINSGCEAVFYASANALIA